MSTRAFRAPDEASDGFLTYYCTTCEAADDLVALPGANRVAVLAEGLLEKIGEKGGEHGKYEKWTVDELQDKAKEVGIPHHSSMDKKELIDALRHH